MSFDQAQENFGSAWNELLKHFQKTCLVLQQYNLFHWDLGGGSLNPDFPGRILCMDHDPNCQLYQQVWHLQRKEGFFWWVGRGGGVVGGLVWREEISNAQNWTETIELNRYNILRRLTQNKFFACCWSHTFSIKNLIMSYLPLSNKLKAQPPPLHKARYY